MMLSPQQRDLVLSGLAEHLSDNRAFYSTLAANIPPLVAEEHRSAYRQAILAIAYPQSPITAASLTLELLERQTPPGPQPRLLPSYLEQLANGPFPRLAPVVERLWAELREAEAALPGATLDPFLTYSILGGQPFLDRRPLRPKLRQLLFEQDGPSVLAVSGPKCSGKTYTTALLEHVRRNRQELFDVTSPVELGGEALSPEDVARSLVARMYRSTYSMPTRGPETRNNYLSELTLWVVREARETKKRWCFVIDGANDEVLLNDTRSFIHHLAKLIEMGEAHEILRLVVLDFQQPFPNLWSKSVDRDALESPDHIGQVDVEDYFTSLAGSFGQVDLAKVRTHAQAVIARCPTGQPERMRLLFEEVEKETLRFLEPVGGDMS
jgi:hypothetical protein